MIGAALLMVTATAALAVGQPMDMGGGPHGMMGGGMGRGATGTGDPVVRVVSVDPEGRVEPLADAEVVLEHWSRPPGRDTEPTLDDSWIGTTGEGGRVVFQDVPLGGGELRATLVRDGVTFRAMDVGGGEASEIRVHEVTTDRDGLHATARMGLELREENLVVDQTLSVRNEGTRAVDLTRKGHGLRIPVPLPAVFGGSLDRGLLPPDTAARHMATRSRPERGRFVYEDGAMYWEGAIPPGKTIDLQARYALAITHTRQDLAFSTPLPVDSVTLTTSWPDRVAPVVVPEAPYEVVERRDGETIQRFVRLGEAPEPGEAVVVRVDRLPQPLRVYLGVAWGGGFLLAGLFFLAVLAGRRRHG
ncbi:MAG: hypothetical protein ACQEXJ_07060 [Myxococcota bacterium]